MHRDRKSPPHPCPSPSPAGEECSAGAALRRVTLSGRAGCQCKRHSFLFCCKAYNLQPPNSWRTASGFFARPENEVSCPSAFLKENGSLYMFWTAWAPRSLKSMILLLLLKWFIFTQLKLEEMIYYGSSGIKSIQSPDKKFLWISTVDKFPDPWP